LSVPTETTLRRLAGELRDQGGLLADALLPAPARLDDDPALGALAAAGPRSTCHTDDVAFVIEAIREGYLLHYGAGRLLRDDDRDLVLLAGDHLYALGLARLAALGDLEAVAELADVISLGAQAQAEGRPDLAEAVWTAGAAAVGWGADDAVRAAKAAARAGAPDAPDALRAAARRVSGEVARVR
jgi:hypothetical protein